MAQEEELSLHLRLPTMDGWMRCRQTVPGLLPHRIGERLPEVVAAKLELTSCFMFLAFSSLVQHGQLDPFYDSCRLKRYQGALVFLVRAARLGSPSSAARAASFNSSCCGVYRSLAGTHHHRPIRWRGRGCATARQPVTDLRPSTVLPQLHASEELDPPISAWPDHRVVSHEA